MIGKIWTTGITVKYGYGYGGASVGMGWWAKVDITDDGFCDDGAIRGSIATAYASGIDFATQTILEDAKKMGIEFVCKNLYYEGGGEDTGWPPPDGWEDILKVAADKIGFKSAYERGGNAST